MKYRTGHDEWDELPAETQNEVIRLLKIELRNELMFLPEPAEPKDAGLVEAVFMNREMKPVAGDRGIAYLGEVKIKGAPRGYDHNRTYLVKPRMLQFDWWRAPSDADYRRMAFKKWTLVKA